MKMSHEENRAALLRERDGRADAYAAAVADRDAIAVVTNAPDALPFDRTALRRAESRVQLAVRDMTHWGDPLPVAAASSNSAAAPRASPLATVEAAAETCETPGDRLVRQIIASAKLAGGEQ